MFLLVLQYCTAHADSFRNTADEILHSSKSGFKTVSYYVHCDCALVTSRKDTMKVMNVHHSRRVGCGAAVLPWPHHFFAKKKKEEEQKGKREEKKEKKRRRKKREAMFTYYR